MINSLFALFILFYMLYNYESFEIMVKEILPFKEENKQILGEETKMIIQANAIGIPLLAITQGVFAYIGYIFFGVENAMLYAILTGFASIIPILGTAIVWVPIALSLLLMGDVGGESEWLHMGLWSLVAWTISPVSYCKRCWPISIR